MQIQTRTHLQRPATSQSRSASSAAEPRDEYVPGERPGLETAWRMNAGFFAGAAFGAVVGGLTGDFRTGALVGGGAGALFMACA